MLHPSPLSDTLAPLVFGLALGLIYDLLRPTWRKMGRLGFVADALFCALAALGAFSLAMRTEYGRFGLWSVAAGVGGFLLWLALVSPHTAPIASRMWALVGRALRRASKAVKIPIKSAKTFVSDVISRHIASRKSRGEPP